jgi:hypothetical protein
MIRHFDSHHLSHYYNLRADHQSCRVSYDDSQRTERSNKLMTDIKNFALSNRSVFWHSGEHFEGINGRIYQARYAIRYISPRKTVPFPVRDSLIPCFSVVRCNFPKKPSIALARSSARSLAVFGLFVAKWIFAAIAHRRRAIREKLPSWQIDDGIRSVISNNVLFLSPADRL